LTILTPESVEFELELADLGSRFIAILIDTIIQILIILPVIVLIGLIEFFFPGENNPAPLASWITGILFILLFILGFSGYHIFFELIWNGKTPGKRIASIKVIRDGGFPVEVTSSFIRNLIRIVDFIPFYYFTGIISIVLNKNKKRLGDIVAGTIVIKEYADISPPVLIKHEECSTGINLSCLEKITEKEYILIRELLLRHEDLDRTAQKSIASQIAGALIEKLNIDKSQIEGREYEFLEELVKTLRNNEKFL
jgi:uncharacterized RDD family membrane protein YckC